MKDTTKLVRKQITDRRGRVTTVWVDPRTGGTMQGKKEGKSDGGGDGRPKPDAGQVKELLENTKSKYLAASESEQKQLRFQLQLQRQQVRNIDWKREMGFGEDHAVTTSSRVAAFTEFDKWLSEEEAKPAKPKGKEGQLKELEAEKQKVLKEYQDASALYEKRYGHMPIESAMSNEEKEMKREVAGIASRLNQIVAQKNKLAREMRG